MSAKRASVPFLPFLPFTCYLHHENFSRTRVSLGDTISRGDSKALHWFKLFH